MRTILIALLMTVAMQAGAIFPAYASDNIVWLVCNLEKPNYLLFLDFDETNKTVREKSNKDDAVYAVGSWSDDMISWSTFEATMQSSCIYALDTKRMRLHNHCFAHVQDVIAYSGSTSSGTMGCAFVK